MGLVFLSLWRAPGASEFLAACVGGSMTLVAQRWALKHDREKEEARRKDEGKAQAWAIFFKTQHVLEATTALKHNIGEARERANQMGEDLWQALQFPAHDWDRVTHDNQELLFLIEHKQLDIMQRYQQSIVWMSSLIQSVRMYRDMRVEFLSSSPSDMSGTQGSLAINSANRRQIMPKIAHLKMLSESIEAVVLDQQPQVEQLINDYIAAMQTMVGQSPQLEIVEQQKAGQHVPEGNPVPSSSAPAG